MSAAGWPPTPPARPLTPGMQEEMRKLVFKPAALVAPTTQSRSKSHFDGNTLILNEQAENTMRLEQPKALGTSDFINDRKVTFDKVYSSAHDGKDTETHFEAGVMGASAESVVTRSAEERKQLLGTSRMVNDRAVTFDTVYSSAHDGMDTASHMQLASMQVAVEDEKEAALRQQSEDALAAYREAIKNSPQQGIDSVRHMGHEQKDSLAGDTASHFVVGEGMVLGEEAEQSGVARRHAEKDSQSHWEDGGSMVLGEKAAQPSIPGHVADKIADDAVVLPPLAVSRDYLQTSKAMAFKKMDVDDSGTVTMNEFKNAMASQAPSERIERIFKKMDKSGDDEVSFTEFLELTKKHQRPHRAHLFLSQSAQKYQTDRLESKRALPDFADVSSPASPAYLSQRRTRERIATRKAAQKLLPAAGVSSGFREYRIAERAAHEPLRRLLSSASTLNSPRGAASSPRANLTFAARRPDWWG